MTIPPIEKNRYWVFQMMDMYTFNFDYLGTRATGNGGGTFLIAGPRWTGNFRWDHQGASARDRVHQCGWTDAAV